MNGLLSGLVASAASCGTVEGWSAVIVGFVAGCLYLLSSRLLIRLRIDDVVDAIPVHLVAGTWGVIATGLFSSPRALQAIYGHSNHVGWIHEINRGNWGNMNLLGCQFVEVFAIFAWVGITMTPLFLLLKYGRVFRTDDLEEILGLDQLHVNRDRTNTREIRQQLGQIRQLLKEPTVQQQQD